MNRIFSCAILSGACWASLHRVFLCNVVPKILQQHWTFLNLALLIFHQNAASGYFIHNIEQDFFMCSVVWSLLDSISQDFYLYNVVPSVLRQHWIGFFSCAMLFRASRTTLHRVFTCAVLSQEYLGQQWTGFFLCNVVWSLLDYIAQGFYLCHVVWRVLRQHWTRFFHVECCVESLGQYCTISTMLLPAQCWLMANRQLLWGKQPIQCCIENVVWGD